MTRNQCLTHYFSNATLYLFLPIMLKKNLNHVIVRLMGGLGNQMFQYAAARALSLRLGSELCLDTSEYLPPPTNNTPRQLYLSAFQITTPHATPEMVRHYKVNKLTERILRKLNIANPPFTQHVYEPSHAYWPKFDQLNAPLYLDGFWQNELYFRAYRTEILQDFTFPALPSLSSELKDHISRESTSVCVHVRRGDYITNKEARDFHGICTPEYYKKSITYLMEHTVSPHFFIFCDEPAWVKKNFNCYGANASIIDLHTEHNAYHDMHLMTLCKHHIIANSSFSWWGAWLAQSQNCRQIVCAPKSWFLAQNNSPVLSTWLTF